MVIHTASIQSLKLICEQKPEKVSLSTTELKSRIERPRKQTKEELREKIKDFSSSSTLGDQETKGAVATATLDKLNSIPDEARSPLPEILVSFLDSIIRTANRESEYQQAPEPKPKAIHRSNWLTMSRFIENQKKALPLTKESPKTLDSIELYPSDEIKAFCKENYQKLGNATSWLRKKLLNSNNLENPQSVLDVINEVENLIAAQKTHKAEVSTPLIKEITEQGGKVTEGKNPKQIIIYLLDRILDECQRARATDLASKKAKKLD